MQADEPMREGWGRGKDRRISAVLPPRRRKPYVQLHGSTSWPQLPRDGFLVMAPTCRVINGRAGQFPDRRDSYSGEQHWSWRLLRLRIVHCILEDVTDGFGD